MTCDLCQRAQGAPDTGFLCQACGKEHVLARHFQDGRERKRWNADCTFVEAQAAVALQ